MNDDLPDDLPDGLPALLDRSAALHAHLCPRQVLGARLALAAAADLGVAVPQADKRLLAVVESDGCFSDGVSVASGCSVGHRTLRVADYGKVATTLVDTATGRAVRAWPRPESRARAAAWAPEATSRWEAYLLGYQRMPTAELVALQPVRLREDVARIVSHADRRAICRRCGEEVSNEREVAAPDGPLCQACARPDAAYYVVGDATT